MSRIFLHQKQFIFYSFSGALLFCSAEWLIDVCFILLNQVPSAVSLACFVYGVFFFHYSEWRADMENWINFSPSFVFHCSHRRDLSCLRKKNERTRNFSSIRLHKSIRRELLLRISTKLLNLMALRRYYVLFVFCHLEAWQREKEGCWMISMTEHINFSSFSSPVTRDCCVEANSGSHLALLGSVDKPDETRARVNIITCLFTDVLCDAEKNFSMI